MMEEWLRLYPEDKRQDAEEYLLATDRNLGFTLPGYVVSKSLDDTTQATDNAYGAEQAFTKGKKQALATDKWFV